MSENQRIQDLSASDGNASKSKLSDSGNVNELSEGGSTNAFVEPKKPSGGNKVNWIIVIFLLLVNLGLLIAVAVVTANDNDSLGSADSQISELTETQSTQ